MKHSVGYYILIVIIIIGCFVLLLDYVREELHIQLAPCEAQLFFDEYCKKHLEKYGQEFLLDNEGRLIW